MRIVPAAFAAMLLLAHAGAVYAQGASVPFGGLSHDGKAPVEVTADQLDIDQQSGVALFTGNVRVAQGELRIASPRLRVEYSRRSADGAGGQIEKMHATGGVTINNGRATAESAEAEYTVSTGIVVMTGDVVLVQDENVLAGDRFDVDLRAGRGVMTGRVRTILQQSGGE